MKETLEKVYKCDFCKKKMRSKGSMVRHEKFCKENPNNNHICFEWCKHLKKERINETEYNSEMGFDEIVSSKVEFACLAKNEKMYSYLLEKRLVFKPEFTKGLIRMPLDCNKYEVMETNAYGEYSNDSEV
jgi:hypothetical protein